MTERTTDLYSKFLEAYVSLQHGMERVERLETDGKTNEAMALRLKLTNDFDASFPQDDAEELEELVEKAFYRDDLATTAHASPMDGW